MKRKTHSNEERLEVVERYKECGSSRLTAKEFGVDRHYVTEWAEAYRLYGVEGILRRSIQNKNELSFRHVRKKLYLCMS